MTPHQPCHAPDIPTAQKHQNNATPLSIHQACALPHDGLTQFGAQRLACCLDAESLLGHEKRIRGQLPLPGLSSQSGVARVSASGHRADGKPVAFPPEAPRYAEHSLLGRLVEPQGPELEIRLIKTPSIAAMLRCTSARGGGSADRDRPQGFFWLPIAIAGLLARKATQRTARGRAITDHRELCRASLASSAR